MVWTGSEWFYLYITLEEIHSSLFSNMKDKLCPIRMGTVERIVERMGYTVKLVIRKGEIHE